MLTFLVETYDTVTHSDSLRYGEKVFVYGGWGVKHRTPECPAWDSLAYDVLNRFEPQRARADHVVGVAHDEWQEGWLGGLSILHLDDMDAGGTVRWENVPPSTMSGVLPSSRAAHSFTVMAEESNVAVIFGGRVGCTFLNHFEHPRHKRSRALLPHNVYTHTHRQRAKERERESV